jgi:hypothetical protein
VLSKARRGELITPLPVGLIHDAAGHVVLDPDTAVRDALTHLFATFEATGSATACVKAFNTAALPFPWRHRKGPRKGELDWKPLAHHTVLRVLHNPRYAGAFTYGRHSHTTQPHGKATSRLLPREEWISFIPDVHPGYITLDQYDVNCARLAANAAAHGLDRAAGPAREGAALLQGIIICGRCGRRMTVRYHQRAGKDLPTYLCQRDGIDHARPICATIGGHELDQRIGELLLNTLTPLTVEAAFTVTAELEHRAAEADAMRAAHVERARYHADLARRRTWPSTPETGWSPKASKPTGTPRYAPSTTPNTPTTKPANSNSENSPTPTKPGSINWSPTYPASGTTPPPQPESANASPDCCSPTSP